MYRRKKSTIQTCQPQQIDSVRTTSNLGLPHPCQPHVVTSNSGAAPICRYRLHESSVGPEPSSSTPKIPPGANSRIIRTCANRARNSRRLCTCVLKDLKVIRISRYRKATKPIGGTSDFRAEVFSGFVAQVVPLVLSSGRPEACDLAFPSRCARPNFQLSAITPARSSNSRIMRTYEKRWRGVGPFYRFRLANFGWASMYGLAFLRRRVSLSDQPKA
jgi:hypothetical protein